MDVNDEGELSLDDERERFLDRRERLLLPLATEQLPKSSHLARDRRPDVAHADEQAGLGAEDSVRGESVRRRDREESVEACVGGGGEVQERRGSGRLERRRGGEEERWGEERGRGGEEERRKREKESS